MSEPARSEHLSIGEVLALVQEDFPDVTISKIRFLESQGLIAPERTGSGFRKFYESDIERLRWILRQQGDHFLPLKVIKKMLEDGADPSAAIQTQPTLWSSADSDDADEGDDGVAEGASRDATESSGRDARYRSPSHPAVASSPRAQQDNQQGKTSSGSNESGGSPRGNEGSGANTAAGSGKQASDGDSSVAGGDTDPASGDSRNPESPASKSEQAIGSGSSGQSEPGAGGEAAQRSQRPGGSETRGAGSGSQADPKSSRASSAGSGGSLSDSRRPTQDGGATPGGTGTHRTLSTPADVVAALQEDPRPSARRGSGHPSNLESSSTDRTSETVSEVDDSMKSNTANDSGQVRTPMTRSELCELLSINSELLDALEQFGFISSTSLGGASVYDEDAVTVTRLAAKYAEMGIEPRHLRMYKISAEREAGLIEQLVVPLLKQRNPTARQNASERSDELTSMGAQLHSMFLQRQLNRVLGN
ncbi:MAG TPA: MerR family transcriptional regulator [Microthrixaceae bacterium]|nr:MerR family transcriptional regulator [Microthrixaceae bacterium]